MGFKWDHRAFKLVTITKLAFLTHKTYHVYIKRNTYTYNEYERQGL